MKIRFPIKYDFFLAIVDAIVTDLEWIYQKKTMKLLNSLAHKVLNMLLIEIQTKYSHN